MWGAIARLLAGGTFLVAASLFAADASPVDDDVPDLSEQVELVASEVALELQRACPPVSPSDQVAFDQCRSSLFGDSALRRSLAPRLLWGRRNQDPEAALKDTNLTQFAPDVIAGLYLSLFMFSGEHSVEYVQRERMYLIRLTTPICQSSMPRTGPWRCGCAMHNATTATCRITPCPCAGWS